MILIQVIQSYMFERCLVVGEGKDHDADQVAKNANNSNTGGQDWLQHVPHPSNLGMVHLTAVAAVLILKQMLFKCLIIIFIWTIYFEVIRPHYHHYFSEILSIEIFCIISVRVIPRANDRKLSIQRHSSSLYAPLLFILKKRTWRDDLENEKNKIK